jgi:hypothetical protein
MTPDLPRRPASHVARQILTAFLFTFIAARIVVFLIMAHLMPDLFLHMGGTHVHHLNYGIFLLSAAGAYLLFVEPAGPRLTAVTFAYGIGLALTFDEFGMWLHLGGGYWQRASFDAVVVIAATLGLIASAPAIKRFRTHHWATAALLLVAVVTFAILLARSFDYASHRIGPRLQNLERSGPP